MCETSFCGCNFIQNKTSNDGAAVHFFKKGPNMALRKVNSPQCFRGFSVVWGGGSRDSLLDGVSQIMGFLHSKKILSKDDKTPVAPQDLWHSPRLSVYQKIPPQVQPPHPRHNVSLTHFHITNTLRHSYLAALNYWAPRGAEVNPGVGPSSSEPGHS